MRKQIWTIGHSTRTLKEFISLLHENGIGILADVRSYPGSQRYPHFNQDILSRALQREGIEYIHLPLLGGRRKPRPDSVNLAWEHEAFRGYADYMETADFRAGMKELTSCAHEKNTAYMCSEAVWWRCHRSLISDCLKSKGWKVLHIMFRGKTEEHPYTSAASIKNGELSYREHATLFTQ